jgi:hypothetical protein
MASSAEHAADAELARAVRGPRDTGSADLERPGARVQWWLPWWIVLPASGLALVLDALIAGHRYRRGDWPEGPAVVGLIALVLLLHVILLGGAARYVCRARRGTSCRG